MNTYIHVRGNCFSRDAYLLTPTVGGTCFGHFTRIQFDSNPPRDQSNPRFEPRSNSSRVELDSNLGSTRFESARISSQLESSRIRFESNSTRLELTRTRVNSNPILIQLDSIRVDSNLESDSTRFELDSNRAKVQKVGSSRSLTDSNQCYFGCDKALEMRVDAETVTMCNCSSS